LIIDGRNALSRDQVTSQGFQYIGIGGVSGMSTQTPSLTKT
jgi:hypothetical protein